MQEPSHEEKYLALLRHVMQDGDPRKERTGIGTLSVFGATLRFDIGDGAIPLLTTKKVAWKTAMRELLWFLSGDTNIRPLVAQGVHIWTDWPLAKYRERVDPDISKADFEARLGNEWFAAAWGDLGPVYGKQWRHWRGYDGDEIDQVAQVIDLLKTNPTSRRILFHAWNVAELSTMALPPCHLLYQFHVTRGTRLNCLLYQRSADLFLGVPFNLIEAAALTMMLAQQTGLEPGELIWTGGDVHVYANHLDAVNTQLKHVPRAQPRMRITKEVNIDSYTIEDFVVTDYDPWPAIHAPVAI